MLERYITEVWVSPQAKKKVAGVLRNMENADAGWKDLGALRWALSKSGCPAGDVDLILYNWAAYLARAGEALESFRALRVARENEEMEKQIEREYRLLERAQAHRAVREGIRRGGTETNVTGEIRALRERLERLESTIEGLKRR